MTIFQWEKETYQNTVVVRDRLLRPLARLATMLRISPSMVTLTSIISTLLYVSCIRKSILIASYFIVYAIFADNFDGVLARYQNTATDRGKFTDVLADNVNFTLLVVGLAYAGLTDAFICMILVYLVLLSKTLRMIIRAPYYRTDWLFKPVAGLIPNLLSAGAYVLFFIMLAFGRNYTTISFYAFSAILMIDVTSCYLSIMHMKARK